MKNRIIFLLFLVLFSFFNCKKGDDNTGPTEPDKIITDDYDVMSNGSIVATTGFGMGVNDSENRRNWVQQDSTDMVLSYPGTSLTWGATFITVNGDPVSTGKHWIDISACDTLSVEMKGDKGGESVKIGIKDKDDPDDGTETKLSINLTQEWKVYKFKLSKFITCDLTKVYVVTEFIFPGGSSNNAVKVYVKNVRILK